MTYIADMPRASSPAYDPQRAAFEASANEDHTFAAMAKAEAEHRARFEAGMIRLREGADAAKRTMIRQAMWDGAACACMIGAVMFTVYMIGRAISAGVPL